LNGESLIFYHGKYLSDSESLIYQHPGNFAEGTYTLSLSLGDVSGNKTVKTFDLIAGQDLKPVIGWAEFKDSEKEIKDKTRLNYGEFWVANGEKFKVTFNLSDDVGLANYRLSRLTRTGEKILIGEVKDYKSACGSLWIKQGSVSREALFDQAEPTEYIAEAEDVNGKISSISFIVHPRENIQPQVRLVAPKEGQYIVAGAIQLQAVVACADDGEIKPESDITLFVDGVRVSTKWRVYSESGANSAFDEIYDELESLYDQKTATESGRADSKNSGVYYGSFSMPEGIVRVSEPLEIKAVIQDKKGALSSHVVTVIAAPDEVKPEVLIWQPDFAYAPIENTDFTLSLSAYDNVKVSRIEVYQGYGISLPDGQYIDGDWPNLLLTINNIPAVDAVPVSVENIDTPVYEKTLHVPSIPAILANLSPDLMGKFNENYRIDYRVGIRVVCSNGNDNISYSRFPVRIDERPFIGFVEPLPGASVVEGDRLYVNVHGFDDVGLAYVRLTAYHGNETEADKISELKISGGPYNYLVDVPAYIPDSENNQLILIAEAVDTYGDRIGDLDNHRVSERLSLFIVEDEKPVVTIASPANNAIFTEGQTILVEVNATDDIGIRQSSITVDGMINGNKSLVDS